MHDHCYPPHRLVSSRRVQPDEALSLISDYLVRAEEDNSLHPNAKLTETGPTVHSAGESVGLVLHNLKRLRDGLKGEYYAAKTNPDGVLVTDGSIGSGAQQPGDGSANYRGDSQFEWQNLSEFEQEQEDEEGDLGRRPSGLGMIEPGEEERMVGVEATNGKFREETDKAIERSADHDSHPQENGPNRSFHARPEKYSKISKEAKKKAKQERWHQEKSKKLAMGNGTGAVD